MHNKLIFIIFEHIKIYENLFSPKRDDQNIKLENFNDKSRTIISKLFEKASSINSSETVRHDYTNSIKYLVNLLVLEDQKDELIIKFDYLINYYIIKGSSSLLVHVKR